MVEIYRNVAPPAKDLTGQRFGNLVVEEFAGRDINGNVMWKCRCDCGREKNIQHFSLINKRSKSCGCRYSQHHPKLEGKRFGKLQVIKEVGRDKNKIVYLCRCDCGKELELSDLRLKTGLKSCGCLTAERAKELGTSDLIGKRFSNLTVIEKLPYTKNHRQYWKCLCDCGREIEANTTELTRGVKKNCEDLDCEYSRESLKFRGRLPNWYVNRKNNFSGNKEINEEINLFENNKKDIKF